MTRRSFFTAPFFTAPFFTALRALFLPALLTLSALPAQADSASDMAEMQKNLNAETLSKPFHVEDAAKVDAYVKSALKKNLKPQAKAPANWQPGYTCDSYYRNNYNYYNYRDCIYYYRYYGRYW